MVAQMASTGTQYGDIGLDCQGKAGTNLIVMHADESRATHVLVIDPDLNELERTGHLLGAQGFQVTLSSAMLDQESLSYFAADLLVVRPPARETRTWASYVRSVAMDPRTWDMPVIWLASNGRQVPAPAAQHAHVLSCPWRPLDFLSLVDTLVAAARGQEITPLVGEPRIDHFPRKRPLEFQEVTEPFGRASRRPLGHVIPDKVS